MNVKYYRQLMGFTQEQMGWMFGITPQAYNQKELGKRRFSKDEMIGIKMMVNTSVDPHATIDDIFFCDTPPSDREEVIVDKIEALIQKLETIKGGQ